MKASIDAQGNMTINAETDIEHYALSKWLDDWMKKKVALYVELVHENNPNAITYRQLEMTDNA